MHTHHRAVSEKMQARSRERYCDPNGLPDHVRHARCVCGNVLLIERVPSIEGSRWDVYCICGHRYPLPKEYWHDED